MSADISLIIPVYNTQAYLPDCLASVAAQTVFDRTEVILVDDGSVDASGQICDGFAMQHGNVRVLHVPNGGVSAARNTGIEAASGTYLAFSDSDDTLEADMLEKLLEAARRTGAQLTFCEIVHRFPTGDDHMQYPFPQEVLLDRDFLRGGMADYMNAYQSMNSMCGKLFLHSVVRENGIRLTVGRKYGEDREFVLRFLAAADSACYVPFVGYNYRYCPTSAIEKPRTDYVQRLVEQFASDQLLLGALGMDEARFLHTGSLCWGARIAAVFGMVEQKTRGIKRWRLMRMLMCDPELQTLLDRIYPHQRTQTRFNRMMLDAVRRRSVLRVRWVLFAMRCRIFLYKLIAK